MGFGNGKAKQANMSTAKAQNQFFAKKAAERAAKQVVSTAVDQKAFFRQQRIKNGQDPRDYEERKHDANALSIQTVASILGLVYKRGGVQSELFRGAIGKHKDALYNARHEDGRKPRYWDAHGGANSENFDNIDLAMREANCATWKDAADYLLGIYEGKTAVVRPELVQVAATEKVELWPDMPAFGLTNDQAVCREYLNGRGIDDKTIDRFLGYNLFFGRGKILTLGFDESQLPPHPRLISRRWIKRTPGMPSKMDVTNSHKRYPVIFRSLAGPANRTERPVEVVEGVITGLAAQMIAEREGRVVPTVLVSGGASIRDFVESEASKQILHAATSIVFHHERESINWEDAAKEEGGFDAALSKKVANFNRDETAQAVKERRAPALISDADLASNLTRVKERLVAQKQQITNNLREEQITRISHVAAVPVTAKWPQSKDGDLADQNLREQQNKPRCSIAVSSEFP